MKNLLLILITTAFLSSCNGTYNLLGEKKIIMNENIRTLDSIFHYNPNYQYQIKTDDKINISVWGQEELSVGSIYGIYNSNEAYGKYLLVDAVGNIEVPKVGTLNVNDFTLIELKDSLKTLFGEWIVTPIVDIKILNKDITVLGEVRIPRVYKVDQNHNSLFEMIARSGGLQDYANIKYVKIFRQEGPNVRVATINLKDKGDYLVQNIQLLPRDIVVVPSKKYKEFDRHISVIIPFTSALATAALFKSTF